MRGKWASTPQLRVVGVVESVKAVADDVELTGDAHQGPVGDEASSNRNPDDTESNLSRISSLNFLEMCATRQHS